MTGGWASWVCTVPQAETSPLMMSDLEAWTLVGDQGK